MTFNKTQISPKLVIKSLNLYPLDLTSFFRQDNLKRKLTVCSGGQLRFYGSKVETFTSVYQQPLRI